MEDDENTLGLLGKSSGSITGITGITANSMYGFDSDGNSQIVVAQGLMNSMGTISINLNCALEICLQKTITENFAKRSYSFVESLKEFFKNKSYPEQMDYFRNKFTNGNLEFYKDMTDEELLNFFKITC